MSWERVENMARETENAGNKQIGTPFLDSICKKKKKLRCDKKLFVSFCKG